MINLAWSQLKKKALSAYTTLPFPDFKYGLDIRTDVSSLNFESFSPSSQKPFSFNQKNPDGSFMCDLSTAFQQHPQKIQSLFGSLLKMSEKFEALHVSQTQNGLFIYIPENVQVQNPLMIPSIPSSFSHVLILAEKNARVSIVHSENTLSDSKNNFQSSAVEIFARENAHVTYSSIQNAPLSVTRFAFKRARVEKGAMVDWYWSEFGSSLVKMDVSSFLVGENASTRNMGLFLGDQTQHFDVDVSAHHVFPQTKSHLLARGVLDDSAKAVYRGLLKMTKEAPGSVGNQRADVLLLSPLSEADPVPALEIEGADVRCTHAATVGRLDKDKLFYLTSRGLDEDSARALYIHGFLEFVLNQFFHSHTVQEARRLIDTKLNLQMHADDSLAFPNAEAFT